MDRSVQERFNCKIDQTPGHGPDGDCWLWTGGKSSTGYGSFWLDARAQTAPRVAYQLRTGEIPVGLFVLHSCDTPACVNPDHLSLGTNRDNMDQMRERGRGNPATDERNGSRTHPEKLARGEQHGLAKLTADDVREIRKRYAAGGASHRELARVYGVRHSAIGRIIRRVNWAHVA